MAPLGVTLAFGGAQVTAGRVLGPFCLPASWQNEKIPHLRVFLCSAVPPARLQPELPIPLFVRVGRRGDPPPGRAFLPIAVSPC